MNERSGRKRRLTVEEGRQLAEEYLCGHALVQEAQQFSLMALAAKYGIAPATVCDYVGRRHTRKRSNHKRRLTDAQSQQLSAEYLYGQAVAARARKFSPRVLAAKYGIAPATIYDYVEMRHKGEPGYEKPREGIREVVGRIAPPVAVQALRALRLDGDGALFASAP